MSGRVIRETSTWHFGRFEMQAGDVAAAQVGRTGGTEATPRPAVTGPEIGSPKRSEVFRNDSARRRLVHLLRGSGRSLKTAGRQGPSGQYAVRDGIDRGPLGGGSI